MAKQAVFGPWVKGLNLKSNRDMSTDLNPQELGEALNVFITDEGYLEPRPGFRTIHEASLDSMIEAFPTGKSRILGTVRDAVGRKVNILQYTFTNSNVRYGYLYAIVGDRIYPIKFKSGFAPDWSASSFTSVVEIEGTVNEDFSKGIVFLSDTTNKSYLLAEAFDPVSGKEHSVTIVPSAYNVQGSDLNYIVKDRLFLFNMSKSTMYISPAGRPLRFNTNLKEPETTPEVPADDIVQEVPIEPGYKEEITSVEFVRNNFYIFKRRSMFMFTYQNSPADDGYLRKVDNEKGAYSTTLYRGNIYVLCEKGIFVINGTEYVDIQPQLNLRMEEYISERDITYKSSLFISDFNDRILVQIKGTTTGNDKYYCMNGKNNTWCRWSFNYYDNNKSLGPGGRLYESGFTDPVSGEYRTYYSFVCIDGKSIGVFSGNMKGPNDCLDFSPSTLEPRAYIPYVNIKLGGFTGTSFTHFIKIYRTFMKAYLSDINSSEELETWNFTLNYNRYFYTPATNPMYKLRLDESLKTGPSYDASYVLTQVMLLPIPQQRAKSMVMEITRDYTVYPGALYTDKIIVNYNSSRPENTGYYFRFANFIIDFDDKGGV